MQEYIREVARGKRRSKDLTYEQALGAAEKICRNEAEPAQIGAFFTAERVKYETADEMLAFIETLRTYSTPLYPAGKGRGIDCAGAYDGRKKSFMATIPTAAVLAAGGVPVTLHGAKTLPPKFGVVLSDVLEKLGIRTANQTDDQRRRQFEAVDMIYLPTEECCPPLKRLRPIREQLGVRTLLNTAEKHLLLTGAPYFIVGIFHGTVFNQLTGILRRLPIKRGLVLQGIDGSEDLSTAKAARAQLVEGEDIREIRIDPKEWDVFQALPEERLEADRQAEEIRAVLAGEPTVYRNMVLLNSGVRFWLTERTASIGEGIERAASLIDAGKAERQMERWMSQG